MTLTPDDFDAFFQEVHGYEPFPWQSRLLRTIAGVAAPDAPQPGWPRVLDLPTGSGKTAAIDIAVFHLALEAERGSARAAPMRIAFVVDRRLVVDDAYARAQQIEAALREPPGPISARVAQRLRTLAKDNAQDAAPLLARRLRGGVPRETDWARTPAQPTVICSTVDQVGSRLLFRGYGVTDSMKPVHAGLIGSDCLILLDEAHLAEPFRQTLAWIARYHGEAWRSATYSPPWTFSLLTATPGSQQEERFSLEDDPRDVEHPILSQRLHASKPVRLVKSGKADSDADESERATTARDDLAARTSAIVAEVRAARKHFADSRTGLTAPAIGVVVNRVARARAVHKALAAELREPIASGELGEPVLLIGAARAIDRDDLTDELQPIRTRVWKDGEGRKLEKAVVIVATQCIEAGVDIDLDAVITELAPVDALRQRFGRLNRAGRNMRPFASVVATGPDLATRNEDPVYGKALKPAWEYLSSHAEKHARSKPPTIDIGVTAFKALESVHPVPTAAISEKPDAPVLLPAHVDLLSQTSPVPSADPEVSLYLHGPKRQPDAVSVIWRADIDDDAHVDVVRQLLTLVPPRATEAVELPVWAVRRWLRDGSDVDFPDVVAEPEERRRHAVIENGRRAFLWKGDRDDSRWIEPEEVLPGATLVVPAHFGGLDRFGWKPDWRTASDKPVTDVGRDAAWPFRGRRFAVRVAPGLLGSDDLESRVAAVLAERRETRWSELRDALLNLPLPAEIRADLEALASARLGRVITYTDPYGEDDAGRPRGIVFLAPLGLKTDSSATNEQPSSTEDDTAGSLPGYPLPLEVHSQDVEKCAEGFARAAGLPEPLVADLKLAGLLHDKGKRDPRFQAWLQYGDPLGPDPEAVLAKSARRLPRRARAASGLPERWRHEALSVRLARASEQLATATDPMLVLWLVGTHHGFGRPLFPHHDPTEPPGDLGPQSLAFEWHGLDWATMFEHLKARYGAWGLAHMEAIVRLADHHASNARATEKTP